MSVAPIITVQVPAKINLFLNITGRREDGYHELVSLMQTIAIYDTLELRFLEEDSHGRPFARMARRIIRTHSLKRMLGSLGMTLHPLSSLRGDERSEPTWQSPSKKPLFFLEKNFQLNIHPDSQAAVIHEEGFLQQNLIQKAVECFTRAYHEKFSQPPALSGLTITLTKRIPAQAGLGGGSADAAATLLGLNVLLSHAFQPAELTAMAAQLGSDVPFFLSGAMSLATGRGEQLKPIDPLPFPPSAIPLVVVQPVNLGISTPEAYRLIRETENYESRDIAPMLSCLARQSEPSTFLQELETYLWNDFEAALFPQYPALRQMRQGFLSAGIQRPLLTGSGSAMIGFLSSEEAFSGKQRETLQAVFPAEEFRVFFTTFSGGAEILINK